MNLDVVVGVQSATVTAVPVRQKLMPQVGSRGGRVSVLGLWEPQVGFEYALIQGGFLWQRYIEVIDWVATKAQQTLNKTGRITVVIPGRWLLA